MRVIKPCTSRDAMRRSRCSTGDVKIALRLRSSRSTALHLAEGCSVRQWLCETGIETQPGPGSSREIGYDAQDYDGIDLRYYKQVGGTSSSGSSGGSGSTASRALGDILQMQQDGTQTGRKRSRTAGASSDKHHERGSDTKLNQVEEGGDRVPLHTSAEQTARNQALDGGDLVPLHALVGPDTVLSQAVGGGDHVPPPHGG